MAKNVPLTVREWCDISEEEHGTLLDIRYCVEECETICLRGEVAKTMVKEGVGYSAIEKALPNPKGKEIK